MKLNYISVMFIILATLLGAGISFSAAAEPLRIEHAPVTLAVKGQDVLFRTQVKPGAKPVKAVTLFYAVSRDAAPYKVAMQNSGVGWYTGTISAHMTAGLSQILYYIEARDTSDATTETPWHTIAVKNPGTTPIVQPTPEEQGRSWTKPALIAGGVVLAGGAVWALSSGGGGGGDGGSTPPDGTTTNAAGTYSGTVTLCVQPPGGSSTCSSRTMTIAVDANHTVSSDTLSDGQHLEGKLAGVNFLLVTSVTTTNGTGDIQYLGAIVNNRISGSIQGTLTTPTGTGTYSGNFSASK